MLYGVAIGLILWGLNVLFTLGTMSRRERLDYPKMALMFVVLPVCLGAIGFVINGH